MKAKVFQLTKEMLMSGLRRSRFDLMKTSLGTPGGGLFTSQEDRMRALKIARMLLDSWQSQARSGKNLLPSSPAEVERFIEIRLADFSFMEAQAMINIRFSGRSNTELVKEAREAIELLRRLGGDAAEKASGLERILKQRIGEE